MAHIWHEKVGLTWWMHQTALFLTRHALVEAGVEGFADIGLLDVHARDMIKTGEDFKVKGLQRLELIKTAIDNGADWHSALVEAQRRNI